MLRPHEKLFSPEEWQDLFRTEIEFRRAMREAISCASMISFLAHDWPEVVEFIIEKHEEDRR